MGSKIKATKDFLPKNTNGIYSRNEVEQAMIEFAKMHVKEALKAALEEFPCDSPSYNISYKEAKDAILSRYPLENIK